MELFEDVKVGSARFRDLAIGKVTTVCDIMYPHSYPLKKSTVVFYSFCLYTGTEPSCGNNVRGRGEGRLGDIWVVQSLS